MQWNPAIDGKANQEECMHVIKTPGSVNAQNGSKGPNTVSRGVRSGGTNRGKVTGVTRRYAAHPRTQGQ